MNNNLPDTVDSISNSTQASDNPENQGIPEEKRKFSISLNAILSVCLIFSVAIAGFFVYQNTILKKMLNENTPPTETQQPEATTTPDPTADWNTYTSPTFNYLFRYPTFWSILMFKENDPKVLYGSNSLQNYSLTEVEKYMDHGLVDWASYLKDKPAIKIDFAVYSKKSGPNKYQNKNEFLDNLFNSKSIKKMDVSDLTIGNLSTEHYKATEDLGPTDVPEINTFIAYPNDDKIIYINLLFWNIKSYELLKKTPEWQELSQILSTFEFTGSTTAMTPSEVCLAYPTARSITDCGDGVYGVVSSLLGGGTTYIEYDGTKVQCPVVGPESISDECKELSKLSCKEVSCPLSQSPKPTGI